MSHTLTTIDRGAAAIGLATVVVANFLYLSGLLAILDPMISMEPFYIEMAARPLALILTDDPGWGPLYALWLKPFVAVLGDPMAVYAANVIALSVAISVLIYIYLLLLTRRAAIAVTTALFFLVCDFNVPLYSKVSGFALIVTLAGLIASEFSPNQAQRMTVAAIGLFVASYARPELYPAAVCLCGVALFLAYRKPGRGTLSWPLTALGIIIVVALCTGTPVFSPYHTSDRLWLALREHFAWNWSRWRNEPRSFLSIWEQEFGDAQTIGRAFANNPWALTHHLINNLFGTGRFMFGTALAHYPVLAPATQPLLVGAEHVLASAAIWGSLITVARRSAWREQMLDRYGHVLLSFAVVAVFCFASATVIFPAPYYLMIPGVLLILTGALAASLIIPTTPHVSRRSSVLAAIVCLAALPKPFVLTSAYAVPGSPFKGRIIVARTITDTVDFVHSLSLPKPVQVLTLTDGIGALLGDGFNEVKIWEKGALPLEDYIREKHVDVIVSLEPGRDSFAVEDPYWHLLHESPEAAGFVRLSVPNQENVRVYLGTGALSER